jgi:DNA-binding NtrC family response regulator
LVIGIVNEDPERVTREEELRLLEAAREFLGHAEAARLYEALHKSRRLRPDLVYRLRRGIYIRMPSLRDRREDIPLLFSHFCDGPVKAQAGKERVKIVCDLEAFDLLMRRDLQWPGNIRQLQTFASKVANAIWDDFVKSTEPPREVTIAGDDYKILPIRRSHIETVLRDEFRNQLGKRDNASG